MDQIIESCSHEIRARARRSLQGVSSPWAGVAPCTVESLRLKEAKLGEVATTIWISFHWPCHATPATWLKTFNIFQLICGKSPLHLWKQSKNCLFAARTNLIHGDKGTPTFPWLLDMGCNVLPDKTDHENTHINWTMTMTHQGKCRHAMRHFPNCPADDKHLSNVS